MAKLLKRYKNINTFNTAEANLFTSLEEIYSPENMPKKIIQIPSSEKLPKLTLHVQLTDDQFDNYRTMKVILKDNKKYYIK